MSRIPAVKKESLSADQQAIYEKIASGQIGRAHV